MKYKIDDRFQKISDNDSKYTIMDTTSNGWYVLMYDGQPDMEDFVLWTEDEIDEMLEPITEEPTRWRAKKEEFEKYWYVDDRSEVDDSYDDRMAVDNERYEFGNYFKTQEEALKAVDWLKAFNTLRDDTKGFKPDWKNEKQKKWSVFYNHLYDKLYIDWHISCQFSTIIFATEEDALESTKKHEREWLTYLGVKG